MKQLIHLLEQKTKISKNNVESILKLLEEGSTIPFIARYRKEMTGGATDEQLRAFETIYAYSKKLLERKEEIYRLIQERGTSDYRASDYDRRSTNSSGDRRYLSTV